MTLKCDPNLMICNNPQHDSLSCYVRYCLDEYEGKLSGVMTEEEWDREAYEYESYGPLA